MRTMETIFSKTDFVPVEDDETYHYTTEVYALNPPKWAKSAIFYLNKIAESGTTPYIWVYPLNAPPFTVRADVMAEIDAATFGAQYSVPQGAYLGGNAGVGLYSLHWGEDLTGIANDESGNLFKCNLPIDPQGFFVEVDYGAGGASPETYTATLCVVWMD